MSVFNAAYILAGLALFFCGLYLLFHPSIGTIIFGTFSLLSGAFFFMLGFVAAINHVK
jgi:hypothetical protein